MRELVMDQPLFIGFKVDSRLRQHLDSLGDADRKYVSEESSTFLRLCRVGQDLYLGKMIADRLTTDQVEDIRRNVISIVKKIGHEVRVPSNMQILACSATDGGAVSTSIA